MQNFRDLSVWQKSHALTLAAYQATKGFPKEEVYALTSQIRRAASSIGANIAEGCYRNGDAEVGRFLYMAMGSASELECHLLLARDLGFLPVEESTRLEAGVIEVKRMLAALIRRLKADN